jgi:hypothetical protein
MMNAVGGFEVGPVSYRNLPTMSSTCGRNLLMVALPSTSMMITIRNNRYIMYLNFLFCDCCCA